MKSMDTLDSIAVNVRPGVGARIADAARLVAAATVALAGGIAHLSKARFSAARYVSSTRRARRL